MHPARQPMKYEPILRRIPLERSCSTATMTPRLPARSISHTHGRDGYRSAAAVPVQSQHCRFTQIDSPVRVLRRFSGCKRNRAGETAGVWTASIDQEPYCADQASRRFGEFQGCRVAFQGFFRFQWTTGMNSMRRSLHKPIRVSRRDPRWLLVWRTHPSLPLGGCHQE